MSMETTRAEVVCPAMPVDGTTVAVEFIPALARDS